MVGTLLLVASPAYYLYSSHGQQDSRGALRVADHYIKASYARDFREAYRWLSDQDRLAKDENAYGRERGSFTGFTARLAARLAGFIDGHPIETTVAASSAAIRLKLRLPDPAKLSPELLEWDEERLNALSFTEQSALLAKIHRMHAAGKLPFTEAEETLALVKEKDINAGFFDGVLIRPTLPPADATDSNGAVPKARSHVESLCRFLAIN